MLDQLVNLVHIACGRLVELLLGARHLVLARLAVLLDALELVDGLTADVADRDLGVLTLALRLLDEFLAAILGQLRDCLLYTSDAADE